MRALLAGKPVLQHVLDAVRASGLPWHVEDAGHPGMGDSIAAAVQATPEANGWLILPGDLPLVEAVTLRLLADALTTMLADRQVMIPVCNGQRGHPVGFSAACRASLLSLTGNQGAARVISSCKATEIAVNDIGCVTDIDTVQDLERAQALISARP